MISYRKFYSKSLLSFLFLHLFILFSHKCFAEAQGRICKSNSSAQLASIQGELWVDLTGVGQWQLVDQDRLVCEGSRIKVGTNSRASLRLPNNILVRLDEGTVLTLKGITADQPTLLDLVKGFIHFLSRTPTRLEITTPIANAGPEGTEFAVQVDDQAASLWVYEGSVKFFNQQGNLLLNPGEAAQVQVGEAPHIKMDVRPLDAVQWALYYPAIIDPHVIEQQLPQALQANVRESLTHYRQGRVYEALALIETLDPKTFSPQLLTYRAGLYLTFGRVVEAKQDIALTLQAQPNDSEAYALQAIIAVVQNDKVAALQFAEQAVKADRTSPTARLALSYAQQAHFQIDEALSSVEEALRLDGKNALVWARLSELQMSTGYLDRALESAQQAVSLNPHLGKTQTVLGFAHLLQIDTAKAKETFAKAIQLDQADPMPRLGLGLALIREGQLEAGRIELEIAASLDPANSLVRSYLGKAYFEEKRYSLAETQFDLAKARDPNDPTPWFYDAIQKQTQNRPVEALRDIQKSIELNNNRAVYRSKLLLDKDEAARGSSLARIYDNLGFEKRAIMETAKSLSHDPSNHSAHRFLADVYANMPRHAPAQASELLQAQLLQQVNVNPVQASLAIIDTAIVGTHPPSPGLNEFTPIAERNKPQILASGVVGSNSTLGNETVVSAVYDRASFSLGQFHYDTKGFRQNNDQTHNVYNAFMQYALTPKLNVQAELRTRGTEHGQLLLDFDRDSPDPNVAKNPLNPNNRYRRNLNEDIARLGTRYAISPRQDFITSAMYVYRNEALSVPVLSISPGDISYLDSNVMQREKGYQAEGQYQYRGNRFNLTAGGGIYQIYGSNLLEEESRSIKSKLTRERINGYLYSNYNLHANLNGTVGFSYDTYPDFSNYSRFNPKLGLQWNIFNNLRLRMAWFETAKSTLIANQTVEPTQVAGFNQLFDDVYYGTKARRMGIGIDTHSSNKVFAGFEISRRDLTIPWSISLSYEQKENLYRSYLYWPINNQWVLRGEGQFESLSREQGIYDPSFSQLVAVSVINSTLPQQFSQESSINTVIEPQTPHQIDTFTAPLSLSYFGEQGLFSSLIGTYVNQKVDRTDAHPIYEGSSRLNEGKENFFLIDAVLGFRLPKRRGVLSVEARNLLDQEFLYRSTSFNSVNILGFGNNDIISINPAVANRFIPDRTILMRLTLHF